MTIEESINRVKAKYNLASIHIFDHRGGWRIFGFRKTQEGFNASVSEGIGNDILEAIADLADSLKIGPVRANEKKAMRISEVSL